MGWVAGAAKALSFGPVRRLLAWTESHAGWPTNRLVVLTYHRIDEVRDDGRYPGLISATPAQFRQQIELLTERYQIVSLDDVRRAAMREAELPDRAALLTFDDAVEDFATNALPVLVEHGLPAAVFVPTGFVGDPDAIFWWDSVHAAGTTTDRRTSIATPAGELRLDSDSERRQSYRRLRDHCLSISSIAATDLARELCSELGVLPPPAGVMDWDGLREVERSGIACCPHTRSHVR